MDPVRDRLAPFLQHEYDAALAKLGKEQPNDEISRFIAAYERTPKRILNGYKRGAWDSAFEFDASTVAELLGLDTSNPTASESWWSWQLYSDEAEAVLLVELLRDLASTHGESVLNGSYEKQVDDYLAAASLIDYCRTVRKKEFESKKNRVNAQKPRREYNTEQMAEEMLQLKRNSRLNLKQCAEKLVRKYDLEIHPETLVNATRAAREKLTR